MSVCFVPLIWAYPAGLPSGMAQICCFSSKRVWWGNELKKPLSALAATIPAASSALSLSFGLPAGTEALWPTEGWGWGVPLELDSPGFLQLVS